MAAAVLALAVAACSDPGAEEAAPGPFPGSAPSLQALGRDVLTDLVAGDTVALNRFRLTEMEHNETVWPELPASAREVNFPVDIAWSNIELRNSRALRRLLPTMKSGDFSFEHVFCRGPVEEFRTFRVHTECWLVFTDGGGGTRLEMQAFKDVLERGGGFKVFRYYEAAPRPVVVGTEEGKEWSRRAREGNA
ncbi:MAG: hypothetical protein ACE5GJ_02415 [Gemmatimonadota bacterium]